MQDRFQSLNDQGSNNTDPISFDWLVESEHLGTTSTFESVTESNYLGTLALCRLTQDPARQTSLVNADQIIIPGLELIGLATEYSAEAGEAREPSILEQGDDAAITDDAASYDDGDDGPRKGPSEARTPRGTQFILAAAMVLASVLVADGPGETEGARGEASENFGQSAPISDLIDGIETFRNGIPADDLGRVRRDLETLDQMWETNVRNVFERLQDNVQRISNRDARLPISQLINADDRTFREILRRASITDQGDVRALTDYRRQARALESALSRHSGPLARALGLENVRVELVPSLHEAGGAYVVGKGVVRMRAQTIFRDTSDPNFIATLRHELKHFEQDMLILRHSLGEVARGGALTDQMVRDVVERYRQSLRLSVADIDQPFLERAVRDLADRTGTNRLNRELSQRANRLTDSLIRNIDPQLLLHSGPARRSQEARRALREGGVRGLQDHIRSNHAGSWENVFGRPQAEVLSQLGARDPSGASVVRLDQLLASRIAELTTRYHETYDAQPHEVEARAEGDTAYREAAEVYRRNGVEVPPQTARTLVSDYRMPPFRVRDLDANASPREFATSVVSAIPRDANADSVVQLLENLNREVNGRRIADIIFDGNVPRNIDSYLRDFDNIYNNPDAARDGRIVEEVRRSLVAREQQLQRPAPSPTPTAERPASPERTGDSSVPRERPAETNPRVRPPQGDELLSRTTVLEAERRPSDTTSSAITSSTAPEVVTVELPGGLRMVVDRLAQDRVQELLERCNNDTSFREMLRAGVERETDENRRRQLEEELRSYERLGTQERAGVREAVISEVVARQNARAGGRDWSGAQRALGWAGTAMVMFMAFEAILSATPSSGGRPGTGGAVRPMVR